VLAAVKAVAETVVVSAPLPHHLYCNNVTGTLHCNAVLQHCTVDCAVCRAQHFYRTVRPTTVLFLYCIILFSCAQSYMYSPQGALRGDPSGNAAESEGPTEREGQRGRGPPLVQGQGHRDGCRGRGGGPGAEFCGGQRGGPECGVCGALAGAPWGAPRVAPFLSASSDVLQALPEG